MTSKNVIQAQRAVIERIHYRFREGELNQDEVRTALEELHVAMDCTEISAIGEQYLAVELDVSGLETDEG